IDRLRADCKAGGQSRVAVLVVADGEGPLEPVGDRLGRQPPSRIQLRADSRDVVARRFICVLSDRLLGLSHGRSYRQWPVVNVISSFGYYLIGVLDAGRHQACVVELIEGLVAQRIGHCCRDGESGAVWALAAAGEAPVAIVISI